MTRALPAIVLASAVLAILPGCGGGGGDPIASELAAEDAARAKADASKDATKPATSTSEAGAEEGQPRARSALGKARERAERLEDEVAEYQKKLEKAADGQFD